MKKSILFALLLLVALTLTVTFVGCSNTATPSQEQIPPNPEPTSPELKYDPDILNYPLNSKELGIIFQDGYELTDQSILKTEQIGFLSDPQDCDKPYLIDYIGHPNTPDYRVVFVEEIEQQILIALEEWSKLDVVKELLPIGVQVPFDAFSIEEIPPNDDDYSYQWGLNATNGINVEGAWQYTTGSNGTIKIGVFENNF
ncbi:MAG: hypothetical protein IK048_04915 [Clostridia bacterium]|nr:hypothetical protein [Clostridia bacterium]